MASSFETIILAAQKAEREFSATSSTEADNAEVLKEMATKIMTSLSDLVHSAGGDTDYLESWIDGVADDIDRCFLDVIEARQECGTKADRAPEMFRARPGLLGLIVKGANLSTIRPAAE